MIDILAELDAIHREVAGAADDTVRVVVERNYPTTPEDLWEAITDPDRVRRWFMPIDGDLQVGGSFQLQGHAGGDILACEPPRRLRITFGDASSIVELLLAATGDETRLTLLHTVPVAMAGSVAGALFVGPGWDGALAGLGMYVRGEPIGDPTEMASSPEVIELNRRSIDRWTTAVEASGEATPDQVAHGREMSLAQFAPQGAPAE